MANVTFKNAVGTTLSAKSSGAGSDGDPHIIEHLESNSAAIAASLSVMDDWDVTDACKVVSPFDVISVTPTCDTSAYASGDLIADVATLTSVARASGGTAKLHSLTVVDEDDQGVALFVVISSANTTWGTANSAPTISDAGARSVQAVIPVLTTDYLDCGGVRIANIKNINAVLKTVGSANMYCAVVNSSGTPTFTASGLKLIFGVEQG